MFDLPRIYCALGQLITEGLVAGGNGITVDGLGPSPGLEARPLATPAGDV